MEEFGQHNLPGASGGTPSSSPSCCAGWACGGSGGGGGAGGAGHGCGVGVKKEDEGLAERASNEDGASRLERKCARARPQVG